MIDRGYSLLEILIVMILVGLIVIISVPWTIASIRSAKAEREIREIYSNLTEARQRSVQRGIQHLVTVIDTEVDVYEDRNRDGVGQTSEKIGLLSTVNLSKGFFKLEGNVGGTGNPIDGTAKIITINEHGILTPTAVMAVKDAATEIGVKTAQVNCVSVAATRIGQGKYDGTNCKVE